MSVAVTAGDVKGRRDHTGIGVMDSKRALEASDGDLEKAKGWLRQKGIARFKIHDDEEGADGNR
jgi:elongation factor Ts